jgi:DNA/RNA-binding domain of Phe-tRNA-synthetase-like protein
MSEEIDLSPAAGFVSDDVRAELPGLRLDWVTVAARRRPSPREVRRRLSDLSSRYRGANAVALRTQPVPHAYRAFYRQIGLDPDVERIPSEEAVVARLLHGGFLSEDLVTDALLIGLIETGVPVWALDAECVDAGGLGIRTSIDGERLGDGELAAYLPPDRLVVADAEQIHALLFGELAAGREVTSRTQRIILFSVGVAGVPAIHIEEVLWICAEVLAAGP